MRTTPDGDEESSVLAFVIGIERLRLLRSRGNGIVSRRRRSGVVCGVGLSRPRSLALDSTLLSLGDSTWHDIFHVEVVSATPNGEHHHRCTMRRDHNIVDKMIMIHH